jgi:hypothetical protein
MLYCWLFAFFVAGCPPSGQLPPIIIRVTKDIDCYGQVFNEGKRITLKVEADNVMIRRCIVNGSILVQGSNTQLYELTVTNRRGTPIAIVAGANNTVVSRSTINGTLSLNVASTGNIIRQNVFNVGRYQHPIVANGSVGNQIIANSFSGARLDAYSDHGNFIKGNVWRR